MNLVVKINIRKLDTGAKAFEAEATMHGGGGAVGRDTASSAAIAAGRAVRELVAITKWKPEDLNELDSLEDRYYVSAGRRMGDYCRPVERKGEDPEGHEVWLVEYESDERQGRESMKFLRKV